MCCKELEDFAISVVKRHERSEDRLTRMKCVLSSVRRLRLLVADR